MERGTVEEVRVVHRLRLVQGEERAAETARQAGMGRGREGERGRGRQAGWVNLYCREALHTVRATRVTTDNTVHGT